MPDSMPVCVVDTSILIDLYAGKILQAAFQLPISMTVPDVLVAELQEPEGKTLLTYGLASIELSGHQVQEVNLLAASYHNVSINDLFALVLARTLGATLLTGDGHLRRIAEREGVQVHGILWLLDEMVSLAVIPPRLAANALERILDRGGRLPLDECEKRLRKWT